ncbi:MAG TPA: alpha-glucosidase [Caulobacteraceae bacterium]|nr:alpha-glucosidase [Caulobacteraceae bacterium]
MTEQAWWRGAVIYQIYVRSFFDSNGDGQGDLPGVLARLGYIADLGVDAIWLSPVHPSPNRDWGYDVADYDGVQPDYGTMEDLKALVDAAHARGIRVLLDEVLAHTSDEHAWFLESRRGGATKDWYVWADPALDGTAPNNWLSVFGGPAWSYQPDRRQHYHHKFLRQQPKLNWRNPDAREAALQVLETWLARGVDGFRLDVANAYLHDAALTPNPAVPLAERTDFHWSHASNLQEQLFDANLPENLEVLDEIRRRVEAFGPERFVFGEFSEHAERAGGFAAPDAGLHAGYSFPLLIAKKLGPRFIRRHFDGLARHPRHWPCVSFSNHDVTRTVSRFGGGGANAGLARLMLALLVTLKGTTLLYQGEELGLPEADLRRDQLRDPVGDLYYPVAKGRDGCRTPMPWRAGTPNLGFSTGTPWLPAAPEHAGLTVDAQEADPGSALAFARSMIAVRKGSPALKWGDLTFLDAPEPLLAFRRNDAAETVVCVFNLSAGPATWTAVPGGELLAVTGEVLDGAFGPYAALVIRV